MTFSVYRSSAGSGKTSTLVREYLSMLMKDTSRYRNILAITFTNKAANEMKTRILRALQNLSEINSNTKSYEYKYLLPQLIENTNLDKDTIAQRSKESLSLILHNFSDFAVMTIDSFMHRLIRCFTFDLHLPSDFTVELDEKKIISQATDLLISKAGEDKILTEILIAFSISKIDNEKSFKIESDLQNIAKNINEEEAQKYLEKLKYIKPEDIPAIVKHINTEITRFENDIIQIATEANKLIQQNQINTESFYQGKSGIGNYFFNIAKGNIEKIKPNSYVLKTIETENWFSGKCPENEKNNINLIKSQLTTVYNKIQAKVNTGLNKYLILTNIYSALYPLLLLNEVNKEISTLKSQGNIILISEFNKLISNFIINQPVPYIYERLGSKFKHFLIDEFQDTSLMQWRNLIPLVCNGLSEGKSSIIAGDGKQAIYRWRNGEVEQFSKLPYIYQKPNTLYFSDYESILKSGYSPQPLNTNYRSHSEIINFNNNFFEFLSLNLNSDYKNIYHEHQQKAGKPDNRGFVSIEFATVADTKETRLLRITEIISEIISENYNYKDIAVICRTNANAAAVAESLIQNSIPVISSESLLISSSPSVGLLTSMLEFLISPDDETCKVKIAGYINTIFINSQVNIHQFLNEAKNNTTNSQDSKYGFISFIKNAGFDMNINMLLKMHIYDLCEELIRIFRLNDKINIYLQFFLDSVREYSEKKKSTISGFLEWWNDVRSEKSIIAPEGADAVRIMTIHKSKGLEFPVVIYAFADEQFKKTKSNLWIDTGQLNIPKLPAAYISHNEKLKETVYNEYYEKENEKSKLDFFNLLYVVMTRPSERLYVLSDKTSKDPANMKQVPDIFASYLKYCNLFAADNYQYIFGKKIHKQTGETHTQTVTNNDFNDFISEAWQKRTILSHQAPFSWDTENPDRNRKWGNLIHTAISKIKNKNDIEKVVEKLIISGMATYENKDKLISILNNITENKILEPLFGDNTLNYSETEIIAANGITHRPDMIAIKDNKTYILDYKTGKPQNIHKQQLDRYAGLLQEMGFDNIEKYLVYIGDDITIEIL